MPEDQVTISPAQVALEPLKITFGRRDDGSFWLSIGEPFKGPHIQADWEFGEKYLRLFVAAVRAADTAATSRSPR